MNTLIIFCSSPFVASTALSAIQSPNLSLTKNNPMIIIIIGESSLKADGDPFLPLTLPPPALFFHFLIPVKVWPKCTHGNRNFFNKKKSKRQLKNIKPTRTPSHLQYRQGRKR